MGIVLPFPRAIMHIRVVDANPILMTMLLLMSMTMTMRFSKNHRYDFEWYYIRLRRYLPLLPASLV
jgi:hypothetical protein